MTKSFVDAVRAWLSAIRYNCPGLPPDEQLRRTRIASRHQAVVTTMLAHMSDACAHCGRTYRTERPHTGQLKLNVAMLQAECEALRAKLEMYRSAPIDGDVEHCDAESPNW